MGLHNDAHVLAYVTNPFIAPSAEEMSPSLVGEMTTAIKNIANKFFKNDAVKLLAIKDALESFTNREGAIAEHIADAQTRVETIAKKLVADGKPAQGPVQQAIVKLKASGDIVRWWITYGKILNCPEFTDLMIRLHSAIPHACSVERVNSAHGMIHSTLRARLGHAVVQKLMYCYMNLRMLCAKKGSLFLDSMIHSALRDEQGELPPVEIDVTSEKLSEEDNVDANALESEWEEWRGGMMNIHPAGPHP